MGSSQETDPQGDVRSLPEAKARDPEAAVLSECRRVLQAADGLGGRMHETRAPLPAVMSVTQVAELLQVNEKAIYKAIARHELPGVRRIGKTVRISTEAVLAWLWKGRGR